MKDKIVKYLESQLSIKVTTLETLESPIVESKEGKTQLEIEKMTIRHDIYELKKHIDVIKIL